ncbi:hypothetical protein [Corynebacterium camporealensis]|uniref:Uncharacterized protein n=1 Tax=Corynebacterium camporealensis TaxID=161896 RepID=A0A0F6T9V9_9CORY|nr:hypothetical protein [Corynebacterium camporealensis]AKE38014.1 hypothetical protein UL81_00095 [Corynebacterium camporealensis]
MSQLNTYRLLSGGSILALLALFIVHKNYQLPEPWVSILALVIVVVAIAATTAMGIAEYKRTRRG